MRKNWILKIYAIAILIGMLNTLNAQTFNLQKIPEDNIKISFEYEHTFLPIDEIEQSILSGGYRLNFNIPVSNKLNILSTVHYIYTDYEYNSEYWHDEISQGAFGNIFIGIQTKPEVGSDKRSVFTAGVNLPTAELAATAGFNFDYYNISNYFPDVLGLYFNYAYHKFSDHGINFSVEGGPDILIPTNDGGGDTELLLHYGFNIGYRIEKFILNAELLGMGFVTVDIDNFEDRLFHSMNLGIQWKGEIIISKLYYRYYFRDDVRNLVDGLLGLGISVVLK